MWIPILTLTAVVTWLVKTGHTVLALILSCGAALTAYDIGRSCYCSSCSRPFAVFSVKGKLPVSRLVCWACRRIHRKRSLAR